MLVQVAKRAMRDKQPQVAPWLVQIVSMVNIKEQPHQLSTIVKRVVQDKRRQVKSWLAHPVVLVDSKN